MLAVGLGNAVYLWNGSTGSVDELCAFEDENEPVTSLSWCQDGVHLAIADTNGETQLWDVENKSRVRTMRDVPSRVDSVSWNNHILSTGMKDGSIHCHDVRVAQSRFSDLYGHNNEVCGLKWSPDGSQLASGGNDNLVNIWDARTTTAKYTKTDHTAAVKALAWCPWQSNLLATGGGQEDRKINFWNSATGARLSSMDTGSQVTGILWSKTYRELISSHGSNDNQLIIWKYPTMQKIWEVPQAHSSRILHMTMSPDGQTVCSAAADENLKFWKAFAVDEKYMKRKGVPKNNNTTSASVTEKSPDFGDLNLR
jgi:cell division cycle protein 20 (cofactor of APC complex)